MGILGKSIGLFTVYEMPNVPPGTIIEVIEEACFSNVYHRTHTKLKFLSKNTYGYPKGFFWYPSIDINFYRVSVCR